MHSEGPVDFFSLKCMEILETLKFVNIVSCATSGSESSCPEKPSLSISKGWSFVLGNPRNMFAENLHINLPLSRLTEQIPIHEMCQVSELFVILPGRHQFHNKEQHALWGGWRGAVAQRDFF